MGPRRRIGRPPGIDSEHTRSRILAAGRRCFAAHGYGATTNKMIADRADLTPAAIYFHFGGKQQVFVAALRETQEHVFARMVEAVDAEATFVGKVHAMLETSLAVMRDDPDIAGFISVAPIEVQRHPELADAGLDRRWRDLYDAVT